jgi:hypothetical protein
VNLGRVFAVGRFIGGSDQRHQGRLQDARSACLVSFIEVLSESVANV